MLRGGITTYADMYYFEDEVARVTKEAGMRGVLGETIIDFPAPDNKTLPQAFTYTQKFLDHWKGDSLIVAAVAPHSMYTCSEKTLQDSAALARRNNAPILIHIAEAPFELEQSRNKYGLTPVAYLSRAGVLGPDVVGAHCILVDHADITTLTHFGVGCIYNPSSNMKTAAGVMPVVEMLAAGEAIGLATDGAASNNNLDMFEEMDLAAKLQKLARMDSRALPAEQVVALATIERRPRPAPRKTNRLTRGRKKSGHDPDRHLRPACHAHVQRLFPASLRIESKRCAHGNHRGENRNGRPPNADAERTGNSRESQGIPKTDRRITNETRRKMNRSRT